MKSILLLSLAFVLLLPAHAQETEKNRPKYKKKSISIGSKTVTVEIADNDKKRAYGLMFVKEMPRDTGMLFIFEETEFRSFWMKNTLIPLAIGYFDAQKKLIEVIEMEPANMLEKQLKTYPSTAPAKYALEMNKGWFKENKIESGALLKISK